MTVRQVIVHVVVCGRELGQGYGGRSTHYCPNGAHQ